MPTFLASKTKTMQNSMFKFGKATVTVFTQNIVTGYYPPCVAIKSGKYGKYCVLNGINRSEKFMQSEGFVIATMPANEMKELNQAWENNKVMQNKISVDAELNDRVNTLTASHNCQPVAIRQNDGEICKTATLSDTDMITCYSGCGKGTAYVKDGFVHAFHYGYRLPIQAEAMMYAAGYERVNIMLSSTQICFI